MTPEIAIREIQEYLKRYAFLTGSRAYVINADNADWDYVVDIVIYTVVIDMLKAGGIEFHSHSYEQSVYFKLDGNEINLIMLSQERIQTWVTVTGIIKSLCEKEMYRRRFVDKYFRVSFFKHLEASLYDEVKR